MIRSEIIDITTIPVYVFIVGMNASDGSARQFWKNHSLARGMDGHNLRDCTAKT